MSGVGDTILAAIADGARSHTAIVEATGLEAKQVSSNLFHLKTSGAVAVTDDGLELGTGAAPAKRRVHEATAPAVAPPPKRKSVARKSGKRKYKPRKKAARAKAASKPKANGHDANPVEFARFGEYVVIRRKDMVELLSIFERWRQMIEAKV